MRLTGMLVGLKEIIPALENCRVTFLDGDGMFSQSFEVVRRHLRTNRSRRLLVGAINDPERDRRAARVPGGRARRSVRDHGTERVARRPLRTAPPRARAWSARSPTFPEKYGAAIVGVALDILHHRPIPPAVFAKHELVTPENVNHVYPNDELMLVAPGRSGRAICGALRATRRVMNQSSPGSASRRIERDCSTSVTRASVASATTSTSTSA